MMAPLHWVAFIIFTVSIIHNHTGVVEAAASENIGVCYGMLGNDLPPATDVVDLYRKYGIGKMWLFDPNPNTLQALRGSQIHITLGIRNQDLSSLAASPDAMNSWFSTDVKPYLNDVTFDNISAGNEVIPGSLGGYVLPVMQNLQNILNAKNLATRIKVSTVVPATVLGSSYPPSSSEFTADTLDVMSVILAFLSRQGSPLLINVYPYFAYKSDPANVGLDYAQFTTTPGVDVEGNLNYYNLNDATVDAFYSAMEKVGTPNVNVVVTESGWPSDGNGDFTTVPHNSQQCTTKNSCNISAPKRGRQKDQMLPLKGIYSPCSMRMRNLKVKSSILDFLSKHATCLSCILDYFWSLVYVRGAWI